VVGSVIKQYRKTRKAPGAFKKKSKGNYYNYDKPGHFVRDCKSKSAKAVQPARGKAPKRQANAAEHGALSWTAYYDNSCLMHLSEKNGSGYFPGGGGRHEKDNDQIQFNMAFGEPDNHGPEEIEIPPEE
jgi:hypothetical protein